jgi:hypothetical protein
MASAIVEIYPSETDDREWVARMDDDSIESFRLPLANGNGDYVKTDADVILEAERVTGARYVGSAKL